MRVPIFFFKIFILWILTLGIINAQDHFGMLKSPSSGNENVIKIDANDNIYISVWGYGIMRSNNNGATWSNVSNGLTDKFVTDIDFTTSGAIFVTTFGGGVFYSSDNGNSWTEKNTGITNLNTTAVKVLADQRVFVGTYGSGVFYSEDNGENWISSNKGLDFRDIRVIEEFTHTGFVMAGTYGGAIYMTRDSGDTWKWEKTGLTNFYINDLTINPQGEIFVATNGRGLQISVNSGVSYSEYDSLMRADFITEPMILPDFNFTCVVVNNNNEPIIGTRNFGIFKYDRFTWQKWLWSTNSKADGITGMAVNSSGVIFAASIHNEIYRSDDGGDEWEKIGNVVNDAKAYLYPLDKGNIFLTLDNELFFSDDYGYNWTKKSNMPSAGQIMAFDSTDNIYLGGGNELFRSVNQGAGFFSYGYLDTSIADIKVSSDNIIYIKWYYQIQDDPPKSVAGIDAIYTGGKQRIYTAADMSTDIATDRAGGFAYIDSTYSIFYTSNMGADRTEIKGYSGRPKKVHFDHSNRIYVFTDAGLFYSTNMGNSWEEIEIDIENRIYERFIDVMVTPQNRLYAVVNLKLNVYGYNQIYYTDDFGENWTRADESISQSSKFSLKNNYQGDLFVYSNMLYKAFNANTMKKPIMLSPENGEFVSGFNPELVWKPAFKAELYEINISNNPNFTFRVANAILSDTTYIITDTLKNNTTYFYRIRSKTHDAYSGWTTGSFTTTLQAPMLEYPVNDSLCVDKIAALSWFEVDGADNYIVQLSDSAHFSTLFADDTVQTFNYTTAELMGYSDYFWRVKAINKDTESTWSQVWRFRTLLDAAEQIYPADGDINIALNDTLRFSLNYPEEFYHYAFVEIINSEGITVDSSLVINDSSYVSDSIDYGNTYRWRIGVVSDCDEIVYSEYFEFSTKLHPVALISPEDNSSNMPLEVTLLWEEHSSLNNYHLIVATDAEFTNIIEENAELTENSFDMTALTYNNAYYWKVMAYDGEQLSEWSDVWSFVTILTKPQLRVPADSSMNIALQPTMLWFSVEGALFYQLQVAQDSKFDDLIFSQDSIVDVTKVIQMLEPNTWYHWRVRAMSEGGMTEWSDVWTFRTKDNTPVLVYPADGSENIDLRDVFTWNGDPAADAYQLQIARDSSFDDLVMSNDDITETEFQVNLQEYEQTYYWRVRAIYEDNYSDWSETRSFTTQLHLSVLDYISAEISLYPNPTADYVNVKLELKQISGLNIYIADMSGRIIENIPTDSFATGFYSFRWNVSDYPQGSYFVIFEANGHIINKELKVIK